MIPEIGHFALIIALIVALVQTVVPLIGANRRLADLMAYGTSLAVMQFLLIGLAFVCLVWSFAMSDFSVQVVAENSHSTQPLIFRLAGTWGNHEGSMLLWVTTLAVFGCAVALLGNTLPPTLRARVLSIQGMIEAAFLIFILFTSNPFARLNPAPLDGAELNPLLQDIGLALHPPFLYFGYVGFSVAFAFSVAALLEGEVDAAWARWVRPWVLAAWCCLTVGIAAGSYWAYYELGWGGWWYWDPVENASFMPWLMGTALLHSALVVERRQVLVRWTILLGILTFSLSLIGTFLVRSGVLTSVHAFAVDPRRGIFILLIIILATGGALLLFALRAGNLKSEAEFSPVSREASLTINNLLLLVAVAVVFTGTFYPIVAELTSEDRISVGPPYYALTFVPIMLLLFPVMVVGPVLRWKRDTARAALMRLRWPMGLAFFALLSALVFLRLSQLMACIGMALAVWLIAGSLLVPIRRLRLGESALPFLQRLRRVPRSTWSLTLAHMGMGVAVAGITAVSAWQTEKLTVLQPGQYADISGYRVTLANIETGKYANFEFERGNFSITQGGELVHVMRSEKRFYPVRQTQTTEAAIWTRPQGNLYIAIGDMSKRGWVVRLYHHPLVVWIWGGALIMAFGGFVSLSDRKFRIGTPQNALLPVAVPAE